MTNPCNPIDNRNFEHIEKDCLYGMSIFERDLNQTIHHRHKIGMAMLKSPAEKPPDEMVDMVKTVGDLLENEHQKARNLCDNANNYVSCGYAHGYETCVRMFGPLGELREKSEVPTEIKFKPIGSGHLIADIAPEEARREVILDSGASTTAFSSSYYNEEKNDFFDIGLHGRTFPAFAYSGAPFELGFVKFSPEIVAVVDNLNQIEGSDRQHRFIAMFGADFFLRQPIEVNRDSSVVVINQDVRERLKEGNWFASPIYLITPGIGYDIVIPAAINGVEVYMGLDTGASDSSLIKQNECEEKFPKERNVVESFTWDAGGVSAAQEIPNLQLSFGGKKFLLKDVDLESDDSYISGAIAGGNKCGNIGNDVFSGLNFIIDPVTMMFYFSPAKSDTGQKKEKLRDIHWSRIGNDWIVHSVANGGESQKAVIKPGDKLIKIDGREVSQLSFIQMADMKYKLGNQAEIVFERDGRRSTVTIDLSEKDDVPKTPPPAMNEELIKPSKGCGAHLGARP